MINIFLLCYNESVLLPHTVAHYRNNLPSCIITIYDNESTDNSVEIAKGLGCNVVTWSSNNIHDESLMVQLRNTVWKEVTSGWIIVADMDEWLCINETQLAEEESAGVSILKTCGIDMIGESERIDLSDINLNEINKYLYAPLESKKLCFLRDKIKIMEFGVGSHSFRAFGKIAYSSKSYYIKHMNYLGLPFFTKKNIKRYERNELNRSKNMCFHYMTDVILITKKYNEKLSKSKILNSI